VRWAAIPWHDRAPLGCARNSHARYSALLLSSPASAVDLGLGGACPGPVDINISALTPGGQYALFRSFGPGVAPITAGPCAGTVTGLSTGGLKLQRVGLDGGGDGMETLAATVPPSACGAYLQVLDVETCSLSAVRDFSGSDCPHLSEVHVADAAQGQWCDADAPANYTSYGDMTFDECQCLANKTGTQWFVGVWTDWPNGWIGDHDASTATTTHASDWPSEVLSPRDGLFACTLAQIEHRTEPTVSPDENLFSDDAGRKWHYWEINSQTVSQAMAFADDRGARIINPNSIGRVGEDFGTAPTHWCHANARFNGAGNCNSDSSCDYIVGYYE
jgi:hypothetical protein